MSFSDEVNARRAANAARGGASDPDRPSEAPQVHPAELAFRDEIVSLWQEAEEYWRANNMVDARTAWWVEHGNRGRTAEPLTGEAPLPFPQVGTFVPGRAHTSWASAASLPLEQLAAVQRTTHVPGLAINGWFAVCAPGELRELLPDETPSGYDLFGDVFHHRAQGLRTRLEHGLRWNYFQSAGRPGEQGSQSSGDSSWEIEFFGPGDLPNVRLLCSVDRPIEVSTAQQGGWRSEGTLRQLVVAAMASKMA